MKVVVTGASGFVGRHLVAELSEKHDVLQVLRTQGAASPYIKDNCIYIEAMSETLDWAPVLKGVDVIIHVAGLAHNQQQDVKQFYDVNTAATQKLAQDASLSGVKQFIFISSIGVCGNQTNGTKFTENMQLEPHNDYAKSKLLAEQALKVVCDGGAMKYVIIRPPLIYGPGTKGNFSLLNQLVKKLPAVPFGLCRKPRSFISIDNLTDFIYQCVNKQIQNDVFLISDDHDLTTKQFVDLIAQSYGKKVWQVPLPKLGFIILGKRSMIPQLFSALEVDISHAKQVVDWKPKYSPLDALVKVNKS